MIRNASAGLSSFVMSCFNRCAARGVIVISRGVPASENCGFNSGRVGAADVRWGDDCELGCGFRWFGCGGGGGGKAFIWCGVAVL